MREPVEAWRADGSDEGNSGVVVVVVVVVGSVNNDDENTDRKTR